MSSNMARESNHKVERRVRQMAKVAKKAVRLKAKKEKAAKGSTQKRREDVRGGGAVPGGSGP